KKTTALRRQARSTRHRQAQRSARVRFQEGHRQDHSDLSTWEDFRWLGPDSLQARLIPSSVLLQRDELRFRQFDEQPIDVLDTKPACHFPEPFVRPLPFPKELEFLDQNLLPTHCDMLFLFPRRFDVDSKEPFSR